MYMGSKLESKAKNAKGERQKRARREERKVWMTDRWKETALLRGKSLRPGFGDVGFFVDLNC